MAKKFIKIVSKDDTDILINIEKIQYIQKKEKGCVIGIVGARIESDADYDALVNKITEDENGEKVY